MINIQIDETTCIKCSKCVKVCPAIIFKQKDSNSDIQTQNINHCIACGQCVAVCPTDSVLHSSFPASKVHKIDSQLLPSSEQVMALMKSRRSYRIFSKKAIPNEFLDQILEAAHCAPTAENLQEVKFTLVTDPKKLEAVTTATIEIFSSVVKKTSLVKPLIKLLSKENYESLLGLQSLVNDFKVNKNDRILRGATALLLIHTPKDVRFGKQDANLAYQNASLMAQSLGVGQFYTGYICVASEMSKKTFADLLEIEGTIQAGMAIGLQTLSYPKYTDKKDIDLRRF